MLRMTELCAKKPKNAVQAMAQMKVSYMLLKSESVTGRRIWEATPFSIRDLLMPACTLFSTGSDEDSLRSGIPNVICISRIADMYDLQVWGGEPIFCQKWNEWAQNRFSNRKGVHNIIPTTKVSGSISLLTDEISWWTGRDQAESSAELISPFQRCPVQLLV